MGVSLHCHDPGAVRRSCPSLDVEFRTARATRHFLESVVLTRHATCRLDRCVSAEWNESFGFAYKGTDKLRLHVTCLDRDNGSTDDFMCKVRKSPVKKPSLAHPSTQQVSSSGYKQVRNHSSFDLFSAGARVARGHPTAPSDDRALVHSPRRSRPWQHGRDGRGAARGCAATALGVDLAGGF